VTTSDGRHEPKDDESPPPEPPEERRLVRYLGRPLLLAFWTLVVWGTLYAGLFAFAAATEGPSRALARATTGPDRIVGIANLTLAACALVVWVLVGAAVWRLRAGRGAVSEEPEDE
jgi:HAMP domain-containing protein